jgi:hypothetical protein
VFCSTAWRKKLDGACQNVYPVSLYNHDAKRFRCGLTALKGELAGRALCLLGQVTPRALIGGGPMAVLDRLASFKVY